MERQPERIVGDDSKDVADRLLAKPGLPHTAASPSRWP